MTDLELTKLCAQAMGYPLSGESAFHFSPGIAIGTGQGDLRRYAPLHDDAQAMALVKKFALDIRPLGDQWAVVHYAPEARERALSGDLNRAICETVAQMQAAKPDTSQTVADPAADSSRT